MCLKYSAARFHVLWLVQNDVLHLQCLSTYFHADGPRFDTATRVVLAWFSNVGLPPVAHPQLAELHELLEKRPNRKYSIDDEGDEADRVSEINVSEEDEEDAST